MAIVRLGPLTGGISGTVGGSVFVSGRRGTVLRPRPPALYASTPALQSARARFANFQTAWSALPDKTRAAWRTLALVTNTSNRLGVSSPSSGFLLFMRYNVELQGFTAIEFTDPPTGGTGPLPRDIVGDFSVAGTYNFEGQPPSGFGAAIFYLYGRSFPRDHDRAGPCRLVFLEHVTSASLDRDVKTIWQARWGAAVVGQRFCIGVRAKTGDSTLSPMVEVRGAWVA